MEKYYWIKTLLISTKQSTSFFECQEHFDEKQNAFIKSGKKGIDSSKIVTLFIDKSGFYIYLETIGRYIYFRRAIHVEIGYKTLQVITEFDGHYYGILVWIYDLRCKIEQYTSYIKYFYQNLCYRLLVA
uniref:Uncharacterized protein n=1 Tax=Panagrolaimus sp. PS1159 TaxID=55785 RepID=A0AC35ERK3_9BILA